MTKVNRAMIEANRRQNSVELLRSLTQRLTSAMQSKLYSQISRISKDQNYSKFTVQNNINNQILTINSNLERELGVDQDGAPPQPHREFMKRKKQQKILNVLSDLEQTISPMDSKERGIKRKVSEFSSIEKEVEMILH